MPTQDIGTVVAVPTFRAARSTMVVERSNRRTSGRAYWRVAITLGAAIGAYGVACQLAWADGPAVTCNLEKLRTLVQTVRPGQWLEIPNTRMRSVLLAKDDPLMPAGAWGWRGSKSVIEEFGGGAFDGCSWYFTGGGGSAYGGNEVYRFNLETLNWSRLTDPTHYRPGSKENVCPGPIDGRAPVPGRVYDGLIYSPRSATVFMWAHRTYCGKRFGRRGGRGGSPERGTSLIWEFDPRTASWTWRGGLPKKHWTGPWKGDVDPKSGNPVICGRSRCGEYDISGHALVRVSERQDKLGSGSAAIDPKRRRMVVLKGFHIFAVPLDGKRIGKADVVRKTARLGDMQRYGIAYHSDRDTFFLWDGGRDVFIVDPETWTLGVPQVSDGAVPTPKSKGVYGRWARIPGMDVLIGMNNIDQGFWLYRPPSERATAVEKLSIRTCVPDGSCESFVLLADALNALRPGGEVVLPSGIHRQGGVVRVPNTTIRGEIGPNGERAHLMGVAVGGKAALIVAPKADNVQVVGHECSRIRVADRNGACIRLESSNLVVRDVHFHDNQQGILGGGRGGRVVIEESLFQRNGHGGQAHQIYISKRVDELIVRNNRILSTKGSGHAVKSRAARTLIEGNLIAGLDGVESRSLDVPNGGELVVRNNVLVKGAASENWDVISIAKEAKRYGLHEKNSILVERNTIVFEKEGVVFTSDSPAKIVFRDNVVMGDARIMPARNRWDHIFRGDRKIGSLGQRENVDESENRWQSRIPSDRNYQRLWDNRD